MSSAVLEPGLFAYWYFLTSDGDAHAVLLGFWKGLRAAFGLADPEGTPLELLEAALKESRWSPAPVPFGMAQAEGVQARLLALSDMVIVQLIRSAPDGHSSEDASIEWRAFLKEAAALGAGGFGEARVLVGTSDDTIALFDGAQQAFNAQATSMCLLGCGEFVGLGGGSHYLLAVTKETVGQCNAVASLPLACLDGFLHKARFQIDIYQQQAADLKDFSSQCEALCKEALELLGEHVGKEQFHGWLDEIEAKAHTLAESHGMLVNNMTALRDVMTTVAVNLENVHKLIARIDVREDEIFGPRAERVADRAKEIEFHVEYLENAARNATSALQAMRTKISLIRTREGHKVLRSTLDLLRHSESVEAAAWLITLGVMGVACLQGWQLIDGASYARFPPWFKVLFGLVGGASAVMTTDCLAKRRYVKLVLCLIPFVLGIALIVLLVLTGAPFVKP